MRKNDDVHHENEEGEIKFVQKKCIYANHTKDSEKYF